MNEKNKEKSTEVFKKSKSKSKDTPYIDNWQLYLKESRLIFHEKFKRKFANREDICLADFKPYQTLGRGTYGTVKAVVNRKTGRLYAMKILSKQSIVERNQVEHTFNEKRVMQSVQFPFLITLKFFFMDRSYLYFIMPLAQRGEMYKHLQMKGHYDEEVSRFYGGQVVLALEYLHYLDIMYRDLKPENIVVFRNGYIKLTDFGFCKHVVKGRTYSFCGTPEYMAPEIIQHKGYNRAVDWWAFGVLLYEMMVGKSPFQGESIHKTYEKITAAKIRFPKAMGQAAKHLIQNLVESDLTRRYGNLQAGVDQIKKHVFFSELNWMSLLNQELTPPYIPKPAISGEKTHKHLSLRKKSLSVYGNIFKDF